MINDASVTISEYDADCFDVRICQIDSDLCSTPFWAEAGVASAGNAGTVVLSLTSPMPEELASILSRILNHPHPRENGFTLGVSWEDESIEMLVLCDSIIIEGLSDSEARDASAITDLTEDTLIVMKAKAVL